MRTGLQLAKNRKVSHVDMFGEVYPVRLWSWAILVFYRSPDSTIWMYIRYIYNEGINLGSFAVILFMNMI